jgi:hypothetical protein
LVLILIGSGMAFVGCDSAPMASDQAEPAQAEPAQSENAQRESVSEQSEKLVCECAGFFYCPGTGQEFEYWPPGCGPYTFIQARTVCYNHCGNCTWGGSC